MTVYQWMMVGFACVSFLVGVLSLIFLIKKK